MVTADGQERTRRPGWWARLVARLWPPWAARRARTRERTRADALADPIENRRLALSEGEAEGWRRVSPPPPPRSGYHALDERERPRFELRPGGRSSRGGGRY